MTLTTRFAASAVACLVSLMLPASGAAGQSASAADDDARRKAEALYNDVYGAEHAAVLKSTAKADKIAFARKLVEAAKLAATDKALVRVLLDNALKFALADPAGYPLAIEILKARAAGDPTGRPAALEGLVEVLDKSVKAETKAPARHALARELVSACMECASALPAERVSDSLALLTKARAVCRTHLPTESRDLLKAIDAAEAELNNRKKLTERLAIAQTLLKASPQAPRANSEAAIVLMRLNRPAEALAHALLSDNEPLRKLGTLLNPEMIGPAVEIADAFRAAAGAFTADRAFLLAKARDWYEKAITDNPKHPDAVRIKLLLAQLPAREPATVTTGGGTTGTTGATTKTGAGTGTDVAKTKTGATTPPPMPILTPDNLREHVERETAKLVAQMAPNAGKNLKVDVRKDPSQIRVRADQRFAGIAQQLAAAIRKIPGVREVELDIKD